MAGQAAPGRRRSLARQPLWRLCLFLVILETAAWGGGGHAATGRRWRWRPRPTADSSSTGTWKPEMGDCGQRSGTCGDSTGDGSSSVSASCPSKQQQLWEWHRARGSAPGQEAWSPPSTVTGGKEKVKQVSQTFLFGDNLGRLGTQMTRRKSP